MKVHRLCRYADGTLMTVCGFFAVHFNVNNVNWDDDKITCKNCKRLKKRKRGMKIDLQDFTV